MDDLMLEHLEAAWAQLTLAYNTAKNAKEYDTAASIAYAIAETSACVEWRRSTLGSRRDSARG